MSAIDIYALIVAAGCLLAIEILEEERMNKLRIACPDCRKGVKNGLTCRYCLGSGYDQNFEQDVADTFLSAHPEVLEELGEAPDAEGNWTVDQLDAAEAEIRRRLYRIAKAEEEE